MGENEPRSFWVFTIAMIGIVVLIMLGLVWFGLRGHESLEPVHDEEPHASSGGANN